MHHDSGFWFFGGHGFGMVFWWGLIIVGVIVLIRYLTKQNPNATSEQNRHEKPIDIAKRRLASGEINQDEFDKLKKELIETE